MLDISILQGFLRTLREVRGDINTRIRLASAIKKVRKKIRQFWKSLG